MPVSLFHRSISRRNHFNNIRILHQDFHLKKFPRQPLSAFNVLFIVGFVFIHFVAIASSSSSFVAAASRTVTRVAAFGTTTGGTVRQIGVRHRRYRTGIFQSSFVPRGRIVPPASRGLDCMAGHKPSMSTLLEDPEKRIIDPMTMNSNATITATTTMGPPSNENRELGSSAEENARDLSTIVDVLRGALQSAKFKDEQPQLLRGALIVLRRLSVEAKSLAAESSAARLVDGDSANVAAANVGMDVENAADENSGDANQEETLADLALASQTALRSLRLLVAEYNIGPKGGRRSSSGRAWKALRSVADSAFVPPSCSDVDGDASSSLGVTLARLTMGIALSIHDGEIGDSSLQKSPDLTVSRMVASAVFPSATNHMHNRPRPSKKNPKNGDGSCNGSSSGGINGSSGGGSKKRKTDDVNGDRTVEKKRVAATAAETETADDDDVADTSASSPARDALARNTLLQLLRRVVSNNNEGGTQSATTTAISIDLQIVSKIAESFNIGDDTHSDDEDGLLARATADAVRWALGWNDGDINGVRSSETTMSSSDDRIAATVFQGGGDFSDDPPCVPCPIKNDSIPPSFALAARIRPWKYTSPERLVGVLAELELLHSAELICDSVISSEDDIITTDPSSSTTMMATIPLIPSSNTTCQALINNAFDRRLYRLADGYASKYFSHGGRARYAEARFLHACDTIAKVVKRRQVQIVERMVERVDEAVAKVRRTSGTSSSTDTTEATKADADAVTPSFDDDPYTGSEDISIDDMQSYVRDFSLRKLRATNEHTMALRLAGLWGVSYKHDPVEIAKEVELSRKTYLQWNDEGCPGSSITGSGSSDVSSGEACVGDKKEALPIPDLISDAIGLLAAFEVLLGENGNGVSHRTIGFDAEWGEGMKGVAVLQLSSMSHSFLLDIPALTSSEEGCKALLSTVGKLFSAMKDTKHRRLIGFGCKEDLSRLRASPSHAIVDHNGFSRPHWFPPKHTCAKDLRNTISESPTAPLARKNLGLARACEHYLGKKLDKNEQCSDWSTRPLSLEQRVYAALDAWTCAAIYERIICSENEAP